MAPDGTAMIARVRAVAPFQVLEAVVKPPGAPPSLPVEIARSGAGKSISLREASAGPDGRFVVPYDENGFHQVTLAPDGRLIDRFDNLPGGVTLGQRAILDARGGATYLADPNGVGGVNGTALYRIAVGAGKVVPIPFPPGKGPATFRTNRPSSARRMAGCCSPT